jgi:hypothetical protein
VADRQPAIWKALLQLVAGSVGCLWLWLTRPLVGVVVVGDCVAKGLVFGIRITALLHICGNVRDVVRFVPSPTPSIRGQKGGLPLARQATMAPGHLCKLEIAAVSQFFLSGLKD